jgi:hypothetical protein
MYCEKKEYDRSLEFAHRALEVRMKVNGREHPDTGACYCIMG